MAVGVLVATGVDVATGVLVATGVGLGLGVVHDASLVAPDRFAPLWAIRSMSRSPAFQGCWQMRQVWTCLPPLAVVVAVSTSSRSDTEPSSAMKSRWWLAGSAPGDVVTVACCAFHAIEWMVVVAVSPALRYADGLSTPLEASALYSPVEVA